MCVWVSGGLEEWVCGFGVCMVGGGASVLAYAASVLVYAASVLAYAASVLAYAASVLAYAASVHCDDCPIPSSSRLFFSHSLTEYICHVHVRSDGLSCVIISDQEYPSRVCYTLMNKIMDQFEMDFPNKETWKEPSR